MTKNIRSTCVAKPVTMRIVTLLAAILVAVPALLLADTPIAAAATVRPGAQALQVDLLLDQYETEQARRSFWAATVICWNSGVGGKILAIEVCQSQLSTDRLITLCAGVPLFLVIAARKVANGDVDLATCADAIEQLDVDFYEDSERDVATFLAWGMRGATPEERRVMVAACHLDSDTIDSELAALVLAVPSEVADISLTKPAARRMLDPVGERWTMHNLVRGYGRHHGLALTADVNWAGGLRRVLQTMAAQAHTATMLIDPGTIGPDIVLPDTAPVGPSPFSADLNWFDGRRSVLVSLVGQAHREQQWDSCWTLVAAIEPLLSISLAGSDLEAVLDCARDAAANGPIKERARRGAWVSYWRGELLLHDGCYREAAETADAARKEFVNCGDALGAAAALLTAGDYRIGLGMLAEAESFAEQAAAEFEALGHKAGLADAGQVLGQIHARPGQGGDPVADFRRSRDLYLELGADRGLAQIQRMTAVLHRRSGATAEARMSALKAIEAAQRCGDTTEIARSEVTLGRIKRDAGELDDARTLHETAQRYFQNRRDQRWFAASTFHLAEDLRTINASDPAWRREAEQARDIARASGNVDYEQYAEDLLAEDDNPPDAR